MSQEYGDYKAARALFEESLALYREIGEQEGISLVLCNLSYVPLAQGDFATARALAEESLSIRRKLGDMSGVAIVLNRLGEIAHAQGDDDSAHALLAKALSMTRDLNALPDIAESLDGLAAVAVALFGPLQAARIWGRVERMREEVGVPRNPEVRRRYEAQVAAARAASGDDVAFDRAWQAGRAMLLEETMRCATEVDPGERAGR